MTSNPNGNITTVVIEMEPGWLYVKIADPKPEPDRIEFFLRRTIDDWFDAHPTFVFAKAEAITNHREMLGIHVWYHEGNEPQQKTPHTGEAPVDTFSVEVHGQIAQQFSREYIEAVVDDALRILPSYKDRQDSLVVINPRRVAVILDKHAKRGAVLPLDLLVQVRGSGEGEAGKMAVQPILAILCDAHCWELVWNTQRGSLKCLGTAEVINRLCRAFPSPLWDRLQSIPLSQVCYSIWRSGSKNRRIFPWMWNMFWRQSYWRFARETLIQTNRSRPMIRRW